MNKNMEFHFLHTDSIVGGLAILFGAFVGAIRKVLNIGWKGWLWFLSSLTLNIFVGLVAYLFARENGLTGLYPIIVALTFGFIGEKGGDIIIAMVNDYLKFKFGKYDK